MIHRALVSILVPFLGGLILSGAALGQTGGPTPSPPDAAVYFIGLKDGDTLPTKATIHFGLRGMGGAPAGSDPPNSGPPHLIVNPPPPALQPRGPNTFQPPPFPARHTHT